jgi:calcineurin-like phosphoesterase family protein
MVERWNQPVPKGGVVYCLGDFAITGYSKAKYQPKVEKLLSRLNGNKILIVGNHDSPAVQDAKGWSAVYRLHHINVDGQRIIMCHYPMRTWQFRAHGSWMLFGHVHQNMPNTLESLKQHGLTANMCVEQWDYTPVSLERLREFFALRGEFKSSGDDL